MGGHIISRPQPATFGCYNLGLQVLASTDIVVFDFDYTLADSSRAVIECVRVSFTAMGLVVPAADEVRRTIGLSLPETLARLAGKRHRHRAEEFRVFFRSRSDEIMVAWTDMLPGVPDAIRELKRKGYRLGIVSTKFRMRIEATLEREGLREPFAAIVGGEDVKEFKPHPEGLLMAAEQLAAKPEEMVYVGDSVTDAETAKRASVPFVALLSGITPRKELEAYEPWAVLADVKALVRFLGSLSVG